MHFKLLSRLSTQLQSLLESDRFFPDILDLIQSHFHYPMAQLWLMRTDGSSSLEAQTGIEQKITPELKGLISVPVRLQNGRIAAILKIKSDPPETCETDHFITLEAIASQIAVAVQNRELLAEAKGSSLKLNAELRSAQERILAQKRLLQRDGKVLKPTMENDPRGKNEILGKSPALLNLLQMVDRIAPTTATVLIQGESGTGKELIAKRLHIRSERHDRPYIMLNCGALQENLLESELFGHEKGAFTGAVAQKIGLAEMADGGTLFLDEIGEMSLSIQTKVLRFLQEGEFYRIGAKNPVRVDVRILSATNRDLEQEVKAARFREDLYYRLNTITLRMPPLRKRKEDIPLLVNHFMENSRFGGSAPQTKYIDPRAVEAFQNYDWPGNIRELQNAIERLKILTEGATIRLEDIPFNIRMPDAHLDQNEFNADLPLEEIEKRHILRTLAFLQGNKTRAAQSLGITVKTLYNKLSRYAETRSHEMAG